MTRIREEEEVKNQHQHAKVWALTKRFSHCLPFFAEAEQNFVHDGSQCDTH